MLAAPLEQPGHAAAAVVLQVLAEGAQVVALVRSPARLEAALAAECERLVRDDAARSAQQDLGYQMIARYPQTEFTRALLL